MLKGIFFTEQTKRNSQTFSGKSLHKKMTFSIKDFRMEAADLVTFTGEILNGKLYFLCCES